MKKFLLFLFLFTLLFGFKDELKAEEILLVGQNTSDTTVSTSQMKRRPSPIERSHVVEDYLPILGRQMRAQGMVPPKPFFISAIYYHMEIPQTITNARGFGFGYGFNDYATGLPVRMENAKVETNSVGVRAGLNLLPFMSVFGVYMHTEGASKFTAVADGNAVMPNGYLLNQSIDFKADTGAIGVALAYGLRLGRVVPFAVINANYAWTKTDRTENIINTLIASARVGITVPLPKRMKVAMHIGTQYQYMPMGNQVRGQYTVTLPGGTIINEPNPVTITSRYQADAKYASPWTMNAGMLFSPSRYFDIITEFGFLTRFTAMVAVQANF